MSVSGCTSSCFKHSNIFGPIKTENSQTLEYNIRSFRHLLRISGTKYQILQETGHYVGDILVCSNYGTTWSTTKA